jgi:hypothetical protein
VRRAFKVVGLLVAVAFAAIQLLPVDRSNPPVTADLAAPPDVDRILRRSCYDCHSNETRWRWYAYVAPVSWLVADDVHEAREEMNFSGWGRLAESERDHLREEIVEQVRRGEMPLPLYLAVHPGARLDAAARDRLIDWAGAAER